MAGWRVMPHHRMRRNQSWPEIPIHQRGRSVVCFARERAEASWLHTALDSKSFSDSWEKAGAELAAVPIRQRFIADRRMRVLNDSTIAPSDNDLLSTAWKK